MNTDPKIAAGTIRISTGKHTSNDEIETAVKIISNTVKKLTQHFWHIKNMMKSLLNN